MNTLSNGKISIGVKDHGAELCSIKCGEREYLWQADPEFWARHSPVLFPIVGSVWNKEYRSHGKVFNLGQHGFARDMDFTLVSKTENEIWYRLQSSEETLEKYPYQFVLEIGYRIENRTVQVIWRVTNPADASLQGAGGAGEDLYFQIGAHPAFHWPLLSDEAIAEGTAAMKEVLAQSCQRGYFKLGLAQTGAASEGAVEGLRKSVIGAAGCFDPALSCEQKLQDGCYVALDTEVFAKDALVFEDSQVNAVTLCGQDRNPYLTIRYNAPVIGLWSPPGKNAPFVCIEPWYGRADSCNYSGLYEDKPWINRLPAGESFEGGYTIEIE